VLAQLEQCRAIPDFNNYLAFVFASGEGLPSEVRQGAGLVLKNNLRGAFAATPPPFQAYIKEALLRGLALPDRALRHTAGTCAVSVVGVAGGGAWPQLPAALDAGLRGGDAAAVEGALDALYKLWEEVPTAVDAEQPPASGRRPSDALVPAALALFGAGDAPTRALAVAAVNLAAGFMPKALMREMDT
jgi:transportin-1